MSEESIVELQSVRKSFGSILALHEVNLSIRSGHVVGLLGSNGSGKTTLLKHIVGFYLPSTGQCLTLGQKSGVLGEKELTELGYVPQENNLVSWMRARQFLKFVSAFYANWDFELQKRLLSEFEIDGIQRIGNLSTGQRQLLAIVAAVCHKPKLLVLDEPAASLDPLRRIQFLDLLLQLIQDGERTIIISSHILSDIEKVIDHAIIMDHGQIIRDCSLDDLRAEFSLVKIRSLSSNLPNEWKRYSSVVKTASKDNAVLTVHRSKMNALLEFAEQNSWTVETSPLSLESAYEAIVRSGGAV